MLKRVSFSDQDIKEFPEEAQDAGIDLDHVDLSLALKQFERIVRKEQAKEK